MLIGILLHHAPLKYFEIYPEFLNTVIVKVYDYELSIKTPHAERMLINLACGLGNPSFQTDTRRVAVIAKSPIITRIANVIIDSRTMVQVHSATINYFKGRWEIKNLGLLQAAVTFLLVLLRHCLSCEQVLSYEAIELLVEFASDGELTEALAVMLQILEEDQESPEQSLFESSRLLPTKTLDGLLSELRVIVVEFKNVDELMTGAGDRKTQEELLAAIDEIFPDSAFPRSMAKYFPQLKIKAKEIRDRVQSGVGRIDTRGYAVAMEAESIVCEDMDDF